MQHQQQSPFKAVKVICHSFILLSIIQTSLSLKCLFIRARTKQTPTALRRERRSNYLHAISTIIRLIIIKGKALHTILPLLLHTSSLPPFSFTFTEAVKTSKLIKVDESLPFLAHQRGQAIKRSAGSPFLSNERAEEEEMEEEGGGRQDGGGGGRRRKRPLFISLVFDELS